MRGIFYEKLAPTTSLNLSEYTQEQLQNFCILQKRYHLATNGSLALITLTDGNVRSYGDGENYQLNAEHQISNVFQISIGETHLLILKDDGTVYSSGYNDYGQLGIGNNDNKDQETLIPYFNNIIKVAAGYDHSLILNDDGRVYSFGNNEYGQLGLGNYENKNIPMLIPGVINIIDIACGLGSSLLLNNKGQVYSFGFNERGSLGLGDQDEHNVPTLIPNIDNIVSVSSAHDHSLLLTNEGKVYSFGDDITKLGFGPDSTNNNMIPNLVPGLIDIVKIAAGVDYSLVLDKNGTVYGFGRNYEGRLGLINLDIYFPTPLYYLPNIIEIAVGHILSLLMDNEGNVYYLGGIGHENNEPEEYLEELIPSISTPMLNVFPSR